MYTQSGEGSGRPGVTFVGTALQKSIYLQSMPKPHTGTEKAYKILAYHKGDKM